MLIDEVGFMSRLSNLPCLWQASGLTRILLLNNTSVPCIWLHTRFIVLLYYLHYLVWNVHYYLHFLEEETEA